MSVHAVLGVFTALLLIVSQWSSSVECSVKYDGVVRPAGDGRYEAYMIPPYKSNHASFLELLPSGELLMAWFSGTAEGANNCSIVLARLSNGSTQWSKASLVSRREGYSNQNPVLFYDKQSRSVFLFHSQQPASGKVGSHLRSGSEEKAHIWMLHSDDSSGTTWTSPQLVFGKDGSFDRNRIILSLANEWIFPIYYAVAGDDNQHSAVEMTKDHVNWQEHVMKDSNYLVQPSVIRPISNSSSLVAYFRDRRHVHIYTATSDDDGNTWTEPKATSLPNNNAAIQATVLSSGDIAIVYNPTNSERNPICVSLSEDHGKTWKYTRNLEYVQEGKEETKVEFSYPTILQSSDGNIHISYTYNRETIKYSRVTEDWIKMK